MKETVQAVQAVKKAKELVQIFRLSKGITRISVDFSDVK